MLKVTRGETENRQMVLHIELDDEQLNRHMDRAHKRVVNRLKIPGFRQGKAPRRIVEQFVGRDYLVDEALETLVPEAVNEAIENEGLTASSTPRVSVIEREPVVKLDATVPLEPEVTLGDTSAIKVDEQAEKITDERVEESINGILESRATYEHVERPVELTDVVTMNVKGTIGDDVLVDQTDAEYQASPDSTYPLPGFPQQIEGMEVGETREFVLTVPDEYPQAEFIGKNADFTVLVKGVKRRVMPELTDSLVQELGDEGLKTVADLRSRVRENLEAQAEDTLRSSLERQVLDGLVEASTFEIPPMMVEHEAEHVVYDQQQTLSRYNIPYETYLQSVGKTMDEVVEEAKKTAEDRLKRTLVIEEFANANSIEVSDEDIDAEVEKMKQDPQAAASGNLESEETRTAVRRVLKRRAALDKAIEQARASKGSGAGKPKPTKKAAAASSRKKTPARKAGAKSRTAAKK